MDNKSLIVSIVAVITSIVIVIGVATPILSNLGWTDESIELQSDIHVLDVMNETVQSDAYYSENHGESGATMSIIHIADEEYTLPLISILENKGFVAVISESFLVTGWYTDGFFLITSESEPAPIDEWILDNGILRGSTTGTGEIELARAQEFCYVVVNEDVGDYVAYLSSDGSINGSEITIGPIDYNEQLALFVLFGAHTAHNDLSCFGSINTIEPDGSVNTLVSNGISQDIDASVIDQGSFGKIEVSFSVTGQDGKGGGLLVVPDTYNILAPPDGPVYSLINLIPLLFVVSLVIAVVATFLTYRYGEH